MSNLSPQDCDWLGSDDSPFAMIEHAGLLGAPIVARFSGLVGGPSLPKGTKAIVLQFDSHSVLVLLLEPDAMSTRRSNVQADRAAAVSAAICSDRIGGSGPAFG